MEDLARLVQDDLPEPPPVSESGLPVIRTNGRFLRDISHDALKALVAANGDAPWLFVRGTTLARLRLDERGAFAEVLLVDSLRGVLDRAADFVSVADTAIKPQRPPKDVVHDILALPSVPLPALESIAEAPLLLPSGELLVREGYDAESRVFLRLNGLASKLRTDMTLKEALGWLVEDLLVDFPFADDASLAHALCLLLQPFVRLLIDGPTPLFLIDAPARGTGKGLLADVASIVATGHQAHVMALPRNEDEVEKRITSILLAGSPLVLLDNVQALRSTSLSAALTTTRWRGRLLGKSQIVEAPNTTTWLATGNNVALSDEMARRIVPIRLDARVERPEERTGWHHDPLVRWR